MFFFHIYCQTVPVMDLPCVPGGYMGTDCAWPVARWARGTLRSSAALFWVPHLVPRKYGDPMCCPSAKRVDQVCRQPRHWYPACSRRDSGESAPYLRSDSSESEKQLEALSSLSLRRSTGRGLCCQWVNNPSQRIGPSPSQRIGR